MNAMIWLASSLLAFSSMAMLTAKELPTDISQISKPATLKIRVAENAEGSLLEVKGRYEIYDPSSQLLIDSGFFGKKQDLVADKDGIVWGERLPCINQMRIVPTGEGSSVLVNGIQYRGCLEIYNHGGSITIVNEIDVENYLKSILSAQVTQQTEERLLEAIAVIARTNAYYLAHRNPKASWHTTAEEVKYYGYGMTMQNPAIDRAVESTRHVIMTYQNHPFASAWTEDSAGRTARYADIFRKQAATPPGVSAPLAARERESHTWTFSIPLKELSSSLGFSKVSAIHPFLDHDSEKVYAVQLTDGGVSKNIDFFTLQKALSEENLRSNDFEVSVKGDKAVFKGWGKGHGVGLCLYSAHVLAEKGASVSKILSLFYPQAEMKKVRSLEE